MRKFIENELSSISIDGVEYELYHMVWHSNAPNRVPTNISRLGFEATSRSTTFEVTFKTSVNFSYFDNLTDVSVVVKMKDKILKSEVMSPFQSNLQCEHMWVCPQNTLQEESIITLTLQSIEGAKFS